MNHKQRQRLLANLLDIAGVEQCAVLCQDAAVMDIGARHSHPAVITRTLILNSNMTIFLLYFGLKCRSMYTFRIVTQLLVLIDVICKWTPELDWSMKHKQEQIAFGVTSRWYGRHARRRTSVNTSNLSESGRPK